MRTSGRFSDIPSVSLSNESATTLRDDHLVVSAPERGDVRPRSISVALATYNGAKYIRQQLDDLAAQTILPTELVICDDQSSDETLAIAREFMTSAPFQMRVIQNDRRLGYRENFVKCASLCKSDLIAFCDQDDRWSPVKLSTMVRNFDDPNVLLAYHNAQIMHERDGYLSSLYRERSRPAKSNPCQLGPWAFSLGFTQVFRRELLQYNDLWDQSRDQNYENPSSKQDVRLAHDQWYFFLASTLGSVVFEPTDLAEYRQHGTNVYGLYRPTIYQRVVREVRTARATCARRVTGAECRAQILCEIGERSSAETRNRALDASVRYSQLAQLWRRRWRLYEGETVAVRARAARDLIFRKAYGFDPWKLNPLAFGMDLTIGLWGVSA